MRARATNHYWVAPHKTVAGVDLVRSNAELNDDVHVRVGREVGVDVRVCSGERTKMTWRNVGSKRRTHIDDEVRKSE